MQKCYTVNCLYKQETERFVKVLIDAFFFEVLKLWSGCFIKVTLSMKVHEARKLAKVQASFLVGSDEGNVCIGSAV